MAKDHRGIGVVAKPSEKLRQEFIQRLTKQAEQNMAKGTGTIAGGAPHEKLLEEWRGSNGVVCRRLPDDPNGVLRISIGGGDDIPVLGDYAVVRGDVRNCIELLERALAALKERPATESGA